MKTRYYFYKSFQIFQFVLFCRKLGFDDDALVDSFTKCETSNDLQKLFADFEKSFFEDLSKILTGMQYVKNDIIVYRSLWLTDTAIVVRILYDISENNLNLIKIKSPQKYQSLINAGFFMVENPYHT